jgi:hypothetical protein
MFMVRASGYLLRAKRVFHVEEKRVFVEWQNSDNFKGSGLCMMCVSGMFMFRGSRILMLRILRGVHVMEHLAP